MAAPTTAQLLIAIAAMARCMVLPTVNGNQTGINSGPANDLLIPIDASAQGQYNISLGAGVVITVDSQYIHIKGNVGDAFMG